jgi:hypothetical protein
MAVNAIKKLSQWEGVIPNLIDYERACAEFSWEEACGELTRLPDNRGLNMAYECVDRHAESWRVIIWLCAGSVNRAKRGTSAMVS